MRKKVTKIFFLKNLKVYLNAKPFLFFEFKN